MVMERYDNLNLNPASPDYIAARIGDQYYKWDSTERMLKLYGDFPNRSKFIRVLMKDEVDNGAVEPSLLPFGFFGAPKFKDVTVAGIGSAGQHPDASGVLPTLVRYLARYSSPAVSLELVLLMLAYQTKEMSVSDF
jgi:hypothetical protein